MVASTQFVTAPDDSAHGNVEKTNFESHKFQVRCSEADVGFSILSVDKMSQQSGSSWMLPSDAARHRWTDHQDMCERLKCGKAGGKP